MTLTITHLNASLLCILIFWTLYSFITLLSKKKKKNYPILSNKKKTLNNVLAVIIFFHIKVSEMRNIRWKKDKSKYKDDERSILWE